MSEDQLKAIVWCAVGFFCAQMFVWLAYGVLVWMFGRLHG